MGDHAKERFESIIASASTVVEERRQLLEKKAAEVKRLQMEKASLNAELIERNQRQQQYGQDDVMAEKHRILKR